MLLIISVSFRIIVVVGLGEIRLHVSYVELLGNTLSDLLSPVGGAKVEVMEDKFGKVPLVTCYTLYRGIGVSLLYRIY